MDEKERVKKNEEILIESKNFFEMYKKEIGESIRKGKKVIFTSILGVVVISLAYSLTKFVFTSLDQAQTGEEGLEFSTSPAPLPEPGTGNGGSMPWSVN